jgi:hypothetical protein
VLDLLEMQRSALLMFTSCGWFFLRSRGIETIQVCATPPASSIYEQLGLDPRKEFLEILSEARATARQRQRR